MTKLGDCEYCEGTGIIEILYSQVSGSAGGCSNEHAAWLAGEVHHIEECSRCGGTCIEPVEGDEADA